VIPIARAPEPAQLPAIREAELTRVRKGVGPDRKLADLGTKYAGPNGEFKRLMWNAQHSKCGWCERQCEDDFYDVEHYRPKASVTTSTGASRPGYWWLTWTWVNLFFACPNCNRSAKNDRFPLANEENHLRPEDSPPGLEQPLLLDPASDDPTDHIQFRPDATQADRWLATPRGGSRRGHQTIIVLDLNRDSLIELRRQAVDMLRDDHQSILTRLLSSEPRSWEQRVGRVLARSRPFAALSRDVIDHWFPEAARRAAGVTLPRI
jgi:uncharacterized protein (TIGR02646 family)